MEFTKPKTILLSERRNGNFSVLYHYNKMVEYAMQLIGSKPMPSYLKHALSQMIVTPIAEVGGKLQWANKMSEINHKNGAQTYQKGDILRTVREAERLYHERMKYGLILLRDRPQIEERQKIHLDNLVGEFERTLAGWAKYQANSGMR